MPQRVAACGNVLQRVAVCCNVLQCLAVCCSVLSCAAVCYSVLQSVAVCCIVSDGSEDLLLQVADVLQFRVVSITYYRQ